jgi:hypothetical protein
MQAETKEENLVQIYLVDAQKEPTARILLLALNRPYLQK